ncbi:hypothetical protein CDB3_29780 [Bacillus sp. CDB3]|nr:hypothetical protein CDB3_29780 [Bacillus sp. CDB3]
MPAMVLFILEVKSHIDFYKIQKDEMILVFLFNRICFKQTIEGMKEIALYNNIPIIWSDIPIIIFLVNPITKGVL